MWRPLNETYFVKPNPIAVSSLILEEYKKNHVELMTGIVVRVGTGTLIESGKRIPLQAREGDQVMFGVKAGAEVKVDGEKLLLLAEANILAVYKEEKDTISINQPPEPPPNRTMKKGF